MSPRVLLALAALVVSACTNQASTSPGDPAGDAGPPSPLGNGNRLYEIVPPYQTDSMGNPTPDSKNPTPNPMHPGMNANANVTGVAVVTVDAFDETMDGKSVGSVYVQDVGSQHPFSGIELYRPSYQPADLHVAPGDVIDLVGPYQDFAGPSTALFPAGQVLPELAKPIGTFRYEYKVPDPVVVDPADLSAVDQAHFDAGRRWLGMLATVQNVSITASNPDTHGRQALGFTSDLSASGAAIDNELFALDPKKYPIGTKLKSVTGVVTYFFSFHIAPRSDADIVLQ